LCFAFADAFAPPFRPGSFDAVLTPWFVDSVGLDLRETVALVNRALRPGGLWIQVGPLSFNSILSRAYLIEEVHEIAEHSGFRLLERKQERLPYFDSPLSGSWREETVYCFAAEKVLEANSVSVPDFVPPWVKDPTLPIPVSPETFNIGRTSAFTAMVLTLIDGSRSIQDIAAATASSVGLEEDTMQAQLRAFFAKLIQA
jgi:N2227-like protein